MNKEAGMGFTNFMVLLTLFICFSSWRDINRLIDQATPRPIVERKNGGDFTHIVALTKEERDKLKIKTYAFYVHVYNGAIKRFDPEFITVISQSPLKESVAACSYRFNGKNATVEQSSSNCVVSITRESVGTYLVIERAKEGFSYANIQTKVKR